MILSIQTLKAHKFTFCICISKCSYHRPVSSEQNSHRKALSTSFRTDPCRMNKYLMSRMQSENWARELTLDTWESLSWLVFPVGALIHDFNLASMWGHMMIGSSLSAYFVTLQCTNTHTLALRWYYSCYVNQGLLYNHTEISLSSLESLPAPRPPSLSLLQRVNKTPLPSQEKSKGSRWGDQCIWQNPKM